MESHIDDDHHNHSYSSMEAVDDLLEECWFFGNLLNITPKPSSSNSFTRCYSDPCPCSSSTTNNIHNNDGMISHQSMSNETHNNFSHDDPKSGPKEVNIEKKEEKKERKISKSNNKLLTRTKTMPTSSMRNNSINIEQAHHSNDHHHHHYHHGKMTKSDRGASLNLADILPPRHDKGNQRYNKPPRNTDMMRRYVKGKSLRRSTSELEIEEVQGFKDLGFTFDNKDSLSPSVVNILPGLQEKTLEEIELENNNVKRPYLSEAWLIQSCVSPPTPNWASNSSSSEDRKAQIKYWARSVASNIHMEC